MSLSESIFARSANQSSPESRITVTLAAHYFTVQRVWIEMKIYVSWAWTLNGALVHCTMADAGFTSHTAHDSNTMHVNSTCREEGIVVWHSFPFFNHYSFLQESLLTKCNPLQGCVQLLWARLSVIKVEPFIVINPRPKMYRHFGILGEKLSRSPSKSTLQCNTYNVTCKKKPAR